MTSPANQPSRLLQWMDALGDEVRLRLLHLLRRHELGVVELCDVLQAPQSTVSRHLKVLAEQGFVSSRRQGTNNLYRMLEHELPEPQRALWQVALSQSSEWLELRQDELRLARRLAERRSDATAFFAGAAAQWEQLRAEYYGARFQSEALLALLPRTWTVADLGCGTGTTMAQLAPHVGKVVGVDSSPAMLSAARTRLAGVTNVELRQGELEALPLESSSVDAALMILALSYLPDPLPALKEMARVLKPGGRAVVVDLLPHDRDDFRRRMEQTRLGFSESQLAGLLGSAGLSSATVRPLPTEPQVKGPALFVASASITGRP